MGWAAFYRRRSSGFKTWAPRLKRRGQFCLPCVRQASDRPPFQVAFLFRSRRLAIAAFDAGADVGGLAFASNWRDVLGVASRDEASGRNVVRYFRLTLENFRRLALRFRRKKPTARRSKPTFSHFRRRLSRFRPKSRRRRGARKRRFSLRRRFSRRRDRRRDLPDRFLPTAPPSKRDIFERRRPVAH